MSFEEQGLHPPADRGNSARGLVAAGMVELRDLSISEFLLFVFSRRSGTQCVVGYVPEVVKASAKSGRDKIFNFLHSRRNWLFGRLNGNLFNDLLPSARLIRGRLHLSRLLRGERGSSTIQITFRPIQRLFGLL